MHSPRSVTAASTALLLAATMPQLAQAREIVGFSGAYSSGTVVVKTTERALYYVLGNGKAVRYPVGVGRRGKQWTGTAFITRSNCARHGHRRPRSSMISPPCRM
jgi:lipoprotein-anchoring transpeptidase ErfK/SrfK